MKHVYSFTNRVVKSFRGLALTAFVMLGTVSSFAVTETISTFTEIEGSIGTIATYKAEKGSAGTAPVVNSNQIRVYQNGGFITVSVPAGYKISEASVKSAMNTTVAYSIDGSGNAQQGSASLSTSGTYTASSLNASSVTFHCKGTTSSSRLYVKYLSVTYAAESSCTSITPTLTYGSYTVLVGNTLSVSNLNKDGSSGAVTYSSSNTSVLTVNSSTGVVTGVGAGSATVTASIEESGAYCAGSATSDYITVNAPAYTVTFNAGTGSCGTASLTETSGGAGVTLPTASPSVGCATETPAWEFAGWATASQTETTSAPTLYTSGSTYNPSANVTLYAVYSKTTGGGFSDVTESYGFESGESGWTVTVASQSTTDVHSGTYSGSINANGATVKYNTKVATPKSFTFWLKKATTNNNYEAYIEVSSDGSSWTKVGTYAMSEFSNTVWTSKTADLSTYSDVYVRFSYYGTTAVRYVDDVSVTHTVGSSTTTYNSNPNCCTAITPTLTYGSYSVLVGNTIAAPNITGNTGSGTVTYSSSNTSVLTVNSSTGVVTGVGSGTATVTASIAASGSYCAGSVVSSSITVSSGCTPATASFTLGTVNKTFGDANFTNTFTSNNTGAKTFASSNTSVATVNATSGLVTITGVGTTTISVTQPETGSYCAVSTSYTLNVTCAKLATPTGFTAGTVAATTIDFSWNAVANASSYTLTYTDGGSTLYKTGVAGTSTQLTGLTPSTQYLVTVKAVGNGTTYCNSDESTTADVTTTALPKYTVTFNAGTGSCGTASLTQASFGASVTLPAASPSAGCAAEEPAWEFAGWATASQTETTSAPTLYPSASTYTPAANVTLYAVYKQTTSGGTTPATTSITFSTVDGGWTKNLAQADGGDYWKLLESGDYFLSPSIDLSTITSVSAKIGTFGGGTHTLSVQDESSNVWGTASSANSAESTTSVTKSGSLSGTGKVKFVCTTGNSSTGLRVQAITINYEEGSSTTTYNSNPNCVVCDANTLALTSTTQTINIDGTGYANYDVSTLITSKNGNGDVTYSVTPAAAIIDENTGEFTTDTPGTYYVSVIQALGSGGTPICAKTVKDTIVVLATPVVTIVDVTPLTFTANCGEASAAQSVSVTGYNLTANMTATAPTNFLVSSDNSSYGPSATFTQTGGTASGTLYIKANPPASSTDPISGDVTLASTDATDRTLAVSATVSCTPVTVTFLDWDGTSTVWNTDYSGDTKTLPAPTTGACAGWTFSGWTTNNLTAISAGDIVGDAGQDVTLTGNTTYYAVYSQGGGTSTIFSDDFADLVSASSTAIASRPNWSSLTKVYPEIGYIKLGASSAAGLASTVLLSGLTGDGTLTFDLQTFGTDNKDVVVTINNGTITTASSAASSTSNTATYTTSSTKTTHTIALNGGGTPTSITFASKLTSSNRFYLDNVSVVIGSGSYTLSPACCDINLVSPIVTTSSADQSITVSWPSVKHEGVEAATAYEFTYKLASSSADPTVVPVAATGAASYSQTITGLNNCSNYVFTVEAIGDPNAAPTICSSLIASVTTYPGVAYTVNYQYGAGTGTPNVWVSGCSNGASTTLPAVTPNTLAYVFEGWYDGTTRVGGAGDSYTPTADVTLVAQYSAAPTYTLTFVNEGAPILTKTVYSTAAENDRKATEPNANYADYGLESNPLTTACSEAVFVGWTTTETAAQGTETQPSLVTFPYTISGDATLYALWKITEGSGSGTVTIDRNTLPTGTGYTESTWSATASSGETITGRMKPYLTTTAYIQISSSNTPFPYNIDALPGSISKIEITMPGSGTVRTWTPYLATSSQLTSTSGGTSAGAKTFASSSGTLSWDIDPASEYKYFYLFTNGNTNIESFVITYVGGTTTYYSSPVCTPVITVDPDDVATCISAADLKVAVGGTATSTGHTVAARNCSGTSIVPVITGTDRTAFSIDWTSKPLENGRADTVYTVSYKPLTGTSHSAQLQFKTDDGAVVSSIVNLCGTVCTSALFTTQSSTQSSITFAWSAPLSGASLHVWNDITGTPACGPQPYDQTFVLGTETSKTIAGLSASTTFHYQITNGGCVSEVRNITTSAAVGLPVLTASPTLWETMAEANRPATYTNTTIALTGANMPGANVTIALRGETAAFTLVPPATITLDGNGAGSIAVTYNPAKPQTNIAYIDLTYDSDCETKTVTITLVGNVPGIDIVEVNPDASGFTLHTDLEGTPNIVLSQEVEHQGSGRQANDLFFSKYFEATQTLKLLGLYNGTKDTISLKGIRIRGQKAGKPSSTSAATWEASTKAKAWSPTEVIGLDTLQSIAPGKEIILFSATSTDNTAINCISGSVGWEHEGWYPVNAATATAVYKDALRNLFITGTYGNTNASIQTGGDRVYTLERKALDGTWESIDLIGAFNGIDSIIGRHVVSTGIVGMDDQGWVCMDGTNYLTKEAAPLSTNRHLLIRKNTVVDGLNALEQNTEDFATLCTEWEGLMVPKNGVGELTEQEITCLHFSQVSTFNYDGYYASFERIDDNLVTFTAASERPGDWVGSFLNPTETFQDSLRCYNLKISVERYYDTREEPPVERSKDYIKLLDKTDDAAEIAALDTVEVMSTQYRVPILVMPGENLTTKASRFIDLSVDTCRTCDVVVMNGGILTKSNLTDDRDSVRSVFVYNGGRLVVPDGLDYSVQDLSIRAQGDAVGAAYVEGNLLMKNPRIYHDKLIGNDKRYFFTLPYNCEVSKITEMNGKSLGVYGTTWVIQYYDGEQRIINRGLSSNWKDLPYNAILEAGRGYTIAISSDIKKYIRFPMVADATFTEKNTAKALDVTQYGELQASTGALGYNNVGWNLVGNPYISYFTSASSGNDGVNNGTVELGGYYMRNSGGYNENTWTRLQTSNIYVTIPNSNNIGYTQELASNTQLDPFIAFFVQAQATGTLTFATTSRDSSPSLVAASAKRTNETNAVALNLTVGTETDRTTILLDNYHTNSYEVGADLLKWKGSYAKLPYFYSFGGDNTPLAFNAINYEEAKSTVPVAFYMPTSYARYTFSIDRSRSNLEELEHVYLLRNGSVVADLLYSDYTNTNLKRVQENKEFAISIQRAAEVVTPVNPTEDDALMPRAITERHAVRVEQLPAEGTIMVMDAIGRTVATRTLTGTDNMTFELPVDGVYTITVMTPARNYTLKTVIR